MYWYRRGQACEARVFVSNHQRNSIRAVLDERLVGELFSFREIRPGFMLRSMRHLVSLLGVLILTSSAWAAVESQPFLAALRQLIESTDYLGANFSEEDKALFGKSITAQDA